MVNGDKESLKIEYRKTNVTKLGKVVETIILMQYKCSGGEKKLGDSMKTFSRNEYSKLILNEIAI